MTHKWTGGIEGPPQQTFWFSEGLTVHYTRHLMYRSGLCSAEEFLKDVNGTVFGFLTNPHRNMPNVDIDKKFWSDRNVQRLPYQRGSLYFAYVDGLIREASGGKRSLDDLVLSLFERRTEKTPLTKEIWLEELEKEIGSSAQTDFDSIIIKGGDFIPGSGAFGPEFRRVNTKIKPFVLGFEGEKSLYSSEKRIVGLVSGSPAEKAGLQNGDLILNSPNISAAREDENLTLKIKVQRDDKTLEVEYLPRGEGIDGFKWVQILKNTEEK
jgi:predicted metalloprotease with PDZ domain